MVDAPFMQSTFVETSSVSTRGMKPPPVVSVMKPLQDYVRDATGHLVYVNLESRHVSCEGVRSSLMKLVPPRDVIMSVSRDAYDGRNSRRVVTLFPDKDTLDLINGFVSGSCNCNPFFREFLGRSKSPVTVNAVTAIVPYLRETDAPSRDIVQQIIHQDGVMKHKKRRFAILIGCRAGVALKTIIDSHGNTKETSTQIGFADTSVFAFEITVCHAGPAETLPGTTYPAFAEPRFFIEFATIDL